MKKIFIGLLIVAAGAATYYLLPKKQKNISDLSSRKELLIGNWKLDSLVYPQKTSADDFLTAIMGMVDSTFLSYHYRFDRDGIIHITNKDFTVKDSSRYEWIGEHKLSWKESAIDTSAYLFQVKELDKDILVMQASDSARYLFSRLK